MIRPGRDPMVFHPIATAAFNVVAGVAGYVDTDVSATTGTDKRKLWVVVSFVNGLQTAGVRAKGSAIDSQVPANQCTTLFTYVDNTGHVELLRNAGLDNTYRFIGWLK
jgi:hypothetical protein